MAGLLLSWLLGGCALLLAGASAWHPNSWSLSRVVVAREAVVVELRIQTLSAREVTDLDPDGDGFVQPSDLDAVRDALAAYVLEHYVLRTDPEGPPRAGEVVSMELVSDDQDALNFAQYVDLELRFAVDEPVRTVDLDVTLFFDTSPMHQDRSAVEFPGEARQAAVFWGGNPRQVFSARAPPPRRWRDDVALGVEHIVFGWDHLAFLLGLLVASTRLRSVLGVVTAFTVAHSVTLTLAALGWVTLPERPVEVVIALSIAYVGLVNLVRSRPRPLWPEAFAFGLVHGVGFAGVLGQVLSVQRERLSTLVMFNLGIELGQVAVVVLVVVVLRLLPRGPERGPWLAPRALRTAISLLVVALGSTWAVQRALG